MPGSWWEVPIQAPFKVGDTVKVKRFPNIQFVIKAIEDGTVIGENSENRFNWYTIDDVELVEIKNKNPCTCGASHTGFKAYHYPWCDDKGKK